MVSVTTTSPPAGQSVIVGAQEVTVWTRVVYAVDVVYSGMSVAPVADVLATETAAELDVPHGAV